ncbi:MAG TPA: HNH endonuclease signature motif containing protein [Baekduia sp.]|nr:HNH endonuclease signature motif containing protein [Baekduia sp.]
MRRTPLGPGVKSLQRGSTFASRGEGLKRRAPLKAKAGQGSSFTPASKQQRAKVAGQPCIVLRDNDPCMGPVDPGHVIPRSAGGDDDPRGVVPLCRHHHRLYDDGQLSLLEYLEPRYRDELAYAVGLVGLLEALRMLTGERYVPERVNEEGHRG